MSRGQTIGYANLKVSGSTTLDGKTFANHLTVPPRNFRVELTTNQPVTSDYTNFTHILFNKTISNTLNGTFIGSTFTVADAGTYAITASLFWQDNAANTREVVVQLKDADGAPLYSIGCSTNVFGFQDLSTASAVLYLRPKTKISVLARQVSGVTIDAVASASTFFEINKLV